MAGYSGTALCSQARRQGGLAADVAVVPRRTWCWIFLPHVTVATTGAGQGRRRRGLLHGAVEGGSATGPLGSIIFPSGGLWIAWPKKASGVVTDLTDNAVREAVLAAGPGRQQGLRHRRYLVGAAIRLAPGETRPPRTPVDVLRTT